ncbi:SAGA-associated factor 29 like protein [Dufourea novaeangliae]|uniref:SAGA-associated factor 29 like protein n=1 Tax=Dufourea novaeangliae TaxID=178035 RepID=A0A154P8S1_DUFNO|nr:SAGA-associated factor 29 like protein [Dufourea novaeangliae]
MPFTADAAASQIQERLKNLYHLVHEIETARVRSEHNLNNILKTYEKVTPEDKVEESIQRGGGRCSAILRKALGKINEIRAIRNERRIQARNAGNKETIRRGALMKMLLSTAQTLPLYVGKTPGAKPPPLCGAIPAEPTYIAKMGDMVAALVKGSEEEENWILAEVVQFNPTTNKYEVDDIDEEQKDRHTLSRRRVVPLPLMRANPETDPHALFPKGSIVMALYPQTTCFYKAVVNQLPTTATEEYEVLFEDATYADGYSPPLNVAQRYVISIKESKKNKSTNVGEADKEERPWTGKPAAEESVKKGKTREEEFDERRG